MLQANEDRPNIGDCLDEIRCPTLIIVGEHDGRTPLTMAEDLNKAIPRSFLKIVPQCRHFYGYEQPAGVGETIPSFLATSAAEREPATAA